MSLLQTWSSRELALLGGCVGLGVALFLRGRGAHSADLRRRLVLNQIATHRSIRNFERRPVPEDLLKEILSTAMRSSTNGNMQTYSLIVTREPEALKQLALIHDNDGIAKAPLLITFVADWSRMHRWCQLRHAEPGYNNFNAYLTAALDAMVCAQSVALAAEASGLGICFLGSTIWEPQRLSAFFSLPQQTQVVTSMIMGYPSEAPDLRARLPATDHIHQERYAPLSDDDLLAYYKNRETEGWQRYINLYGPQWQDKLKAHKLENLAQVYTCLKYSGQDFRLWSRRFFKSLEEQGFGANDQTQDDVPCKVCGKLSHCLDPHRFK